MAIIDGMITEYEAESAISKKVLMRLPEGQFGFKPHEKSMSLGQLASHIAENPAWVGLTLNQDVMDLDAMDHTPFVAESLTELLEVFDKNTAEALEAMRGTTDGKLMDTWRMVKGGETVMEMPRVAVLRTFVFNHAVHHRGQLSVYLRLMDEPVPSIYGPTADEPM